MKIILLFFNKVYFGATDRHFNTRAEKHLKGRGGTELATIFTIEKEQILKSLFIFNNHSLLKHSTSIVKNLALSLMSVSAAQHYNFSAMATQ